MTWDQSKAIQCLKRLARMFGVTAADRREFAKEIQIVARVVVPRQKRRSIKLERLKAVLAEGLNKRDAADNVLRETDPNYLNLTPDRKAEARRRLLANLRASRSYYRRKRMATPRSSRRNRQSAKPHSE